MGNVVRVLSQAQVALSLVQREFPDYHPLVGLARLAHKEEVIADPRLELEVHKAILPYVAPKLAAVEVKSEVTDERRVIVSLFEQRTLENGQVVDVEVPLVSEVSDFIQIDR